MIWSERLIDFGDSWFSAKIIKVMCNLYKYKKGKVLIDVGGIFIFLKLVKLRIFL